MNRLYLKIIEEAEEQSHLLSEWEEGFIDDLSQKDEDYELSEKQIDILNRIGSKMR